MVSEKFSATVSHHWKEIEKSETLAKLFPEPPVVAFRRSKGIEDTLVRAGIYTFTDSRLV
jgi:hypothetical protein